MTQSFEGMDLIDRVREIKLRVQNRLEMVDTEEATKNALIMPFINHVLGYNVFEPSEVMPEFTADVGTKKGEKVDYAIMQGGSPVILIECKRAGSDLDSEQHASQLYRYFSVTEARFGVLTNGTLYKFFADLEQANKMDARPFFEFDVLESSDADVEQLRRFAKTAFDVDKILSTAKDLKYIREVKRLLAADSERPSWEYSRYLASQVYSGPRTKQVVEQFQRVGKLAFQQFIAERVNDRLKSAMQPEAEVPVVEEDDGIVTTDEELRAFHIVQAILSQDVDHSRIQHRDTKSYFGVNLDGNRKRTICRLHLDGRKRHVGFRVPDGNFDYVEIESPEDLYQYADRLRTVVRRLSGGSS